MRIAISGSHRTGKSTLFSTLATMLPAYATVDEPYHLMQEEGYVFSHPPSIDDFEAQLERSIEVLGEPTDKLLCDRCPIDFLAYIALHDDAEACALDAWIPNVLDAVGTLDLVVLVPIEARDRIAFSQSDDDDRARAAVDAKLKQILLDDPFGFTLNVLEVSGSPERRARSVLREMRGHS